MRGVNQTTGYRIQLQSGKGTALSHTARGHGVFISLISVSPCLRVRKLRILSTCDNGLELSGRLEEIEEEINLRPRKILDIKSPSELKNKLAA